MEVIDYRTAAGVNPLKEWLDGLEDLQAVTVILRRIDRLERGHLGDCRFCGEGVWELRIDFGPGYPFTTPGWAKPSCCCSAVRSEVRPAISQRRFPTGEIFNGGNVTKRALPASQSHEEATVESFRRRPELAAVYLNSVLEDGDQEELMLALRRMSEAFGGVSQLAADAKLNATTLYRTLSAQGNPELKSLTALLKAMGMRLAVEPIGKPAAASRRRSRRA